MGLKTGLIRIVNHPNLDKEFEAAHKAFVAANGDKTLRLNYDLNAESIVYDVGGYQGQWSSDIFSKYLCQIHIFEPVRQFYTELQQRFERNPQIVVHDFGLAISNSTQEIFLDADGSSLFGKSEESETIKLRAINDFVIESNHSRIDLVKINIEGEEYDLLESMIKNGIIERFQNLQIQFHTFISNAKERRDAIRLALQKTHRLTYDYPFVWENWAIK